MADAYNYDQACKMLRCDSKTLRKWIERDELASGGDKYDHRVKTLTYQQIADLGAAHGRSLDAPTPTVPELQRIVTQQQRRIDLLEAERQRMAQIEADLAETRTTLASIVEATQKRTQRAYTWEQGDAGDSDDSSTDKPPKSKPRRSQGHAGTGYGKGVLTFHEESGLMRASSVGRLVSAHCDVRADAARKPDFMSNVPDEVRMSRNALVSWLHETYAPQRGHTFHSCDGTNEANTDCYCHNLL